MQRDKHISPKLQAIPTLLTLGCCSRCVLRFLNERTFALYRQTDEVNPLAAVDIWFPHSNQYLSVLLDQLIDGIPVEEKAKYEEWKNRMKGWPVVASCSKSLTVSQMNSQCALRAWECCRKFAPKASQKNCSMPSLHAAMNLRDTP